MYHFYKGIITGSIGKKEYYILANSIYKAELKLYSIYDENSRVFGELESIEIYSIIASEYYGAVKYNKNVL